ncbi:MAG: penicillin-binding protein 1A [Brevinematia bacterium]
MIRRVIRTFLSNLTLKDFIKFIILTFILSGVLFGTFLGITIASLYNPEDVKNLRYLALPEPMKVYDKNGNFVAELFIEKRIPVSYNQISKNIVNSFIAVEDEDFFFHRGISVQRIIKALVKNIFSGKVKEGASTITQQLAKRIFTSGERNIFRKIVEIWYAIQIEKEYSKEEIMEIYLNQIYFGYGAYGVEMASRIYFGKSAKNLDVGESALLASIPKGPHIYSPFVNIKNAQKRQYIVLKRMASLGFIPENKIDEIFIDFWQRYTPLINSLKLKVAENEQKAPYFVEYVRQVVSKMFGDEAVYKSGYKVYTTLDLNKSIVAEKALYKYRDFAQKIYEENVSKLMKENQGYVDILLALSEVIPILKVKTSSKIIELKKNIKDLYYIMFLTSETFGAEKIRANSYDIFLSISEKKLRENIIECALVSINAKNGYVEVMIGGSEFSPLNRLNRAIQAKRQLGSAFKPFLYSAAIDSKLVTAGSVFIDQPIEYRFAGRTWAPKNYEGNFSGPVTLREALYRSLNTVSVQVLDKIGLGILRNYVKKFFNMDDKEVNKYINSMASALGTLEVSPLELATASTVFYRGGTRIEPILILRIEDKYGRVLKDFSKEVNTTPSQVISPQTSFILTSMMRDVVNRGTGALIRSVGFYGDAAGKTGTTSYWRDAWFMGFTGDGLVTVIWFGFDKSTISMGRGIVGGSVAAPAFGEYMKGIYKDQNIPIQIPYTSGIVSVEICTESGKIPTPLCPKTTVEYFLTGTEPTEQCEIHEKEHLKDLKKFFDFEKKEKTFQNEKQDLRDDLLNF